MNSEINLDNRDDKIDDMLFNCVDLSNPKSFFLYAGAGSGKTRSLVLLLKKIKQKYGESFAKQGKKVAVITYTNAACDEIRQRLNFDGLYQVSTIHSFIWSLIKDYNYDIKKWVEIALQEDIANLRVAILKNRVGTKAIVTNQRKLGKKNNRLENLKNVREFIYNPNGQNTTLDSLNHSEVIKIGSDFIRNELAMQSIFVGSYPVLLIDESQDTNKYLMEAFLEMESKNSMKFCMGLFGDTMQRIYADGKPDLNSCIPEEWVTLGKVMNHRSEKRIVDLINDIRKDADGWRQFNRVEKNAGYTRLFLIDNNTQDKDEIEQVIAKKMSEITCDKQWIGENQSIKALTLEHHMAANRMQFSDFFDPLYSVDAYKTSLLDGTLPVVKFLNDVIVPFENAMKDNNQFESSRIIKEYSPLFKKVEMTQEKLIGEELEKLSKTINEFYGVWGTAHSPKLIDIVEAIHEFKLFELPAILVDVIEAKNEIEGVEYIFDESTDEKITAWEKALTCDYSQYLNYSMYISGTGKFDTHQGVKGLEYDRVMAILNDDEARGFMFSYEKLLGVKEASKADVTNINMGKETSIDRTRRLFYVICSRAKESLAIIAYTKEPSKLKEHLLQKNWFKEDEIIDMTKGEKSS